MTKIHLEKKLKKVFIQLEARAFGDIISMGFA